MSDSGRPWSSFLQTGHGQTVKVPHFVGACPNCGGPARANLSSDSEPGISLRLRVVCEGACRLDDEARVVLRASAGKPA